MKLALFSSCLLAFAVCLAYGEPRIDPEMDSYLGASSDLKSIIVTYHDTPATKNRNTKFDPEVVPKLLQENAATSQASTLELLNARKALKASGSSYFQLWFTNKLIIDNADMDLIEQLKRIPEVAEINIDKNLHFTPPADDLPSATSNVSLLQLQPGQVAWGVNAVEAPRVWNERRVIGRGVVVGIIDTGVLATHQDLAPGFRSQYGWFDAVNGNPRPYDDDSHGTHVIGTAVGRNGIGVAPGAQWIACKGLSKVKGETKDSMLMRCMQFMYCPTDTSGNNQNCFMKPKVVVNSWGAPGYATTFHREIDRWIEAGIIGIFSNGNNGPNCGTVGSPGSYKNVIAVGNLDQTNQIVDDSSRGPSKEGYIKPDISAPGTEIYSASNQGNAQYTTKSGTSMAAPHVAGIAALWAETNRQLTYEDMGNIAASTATRTRSVNGDCANSPDYQYPNNHAGHGKITAMGYYQR